MARKKDGKKGEGGDRRDGKEGDYEGVFHSDEMLSST